MSLVILEVLYIHVFQFALILELGVNFNTGEKISFLIFFQIYTLDKHSDCRLTSEMLDITFVVSEIFVSVNPQPNKSSSSRSLKSRLSVFKILNYPTNIQNLSLGTLELESTILSKSLLFCRRWNGNNRKQNNRK